MSSPEKLKRKSEDEPRRIRSDRLVVSGQQQTESKDGIEITVNGGKCMLAALLTAKYFAESSPSSNSLRVVVSGAVAVETAVTAASSGARHLPAEKWAKASFEIPVSLTSTVDTEESEPTPNDMDFTGTIWIIAAIVFAVLVMMVTCRENISTKYCSCFD